MCQLLEFEIHRPRIIGDEEFFPRRQLDAHVWIHKKFIKADRPAR